MTQHTHRCCCTAMAPESVSRLTNFFLRHRFFGPSLKPSQPVSSLHSGASRVRLLGLCVCARGAVVPKKLTAWRRNMDFPALGCFVDETKDIMPEDLDDALLDEVRELVIASACGAIAALSRETRSL